jgi:cytidylate kinase
MSLAPQTPSDPTARAAGSAVHGIVVAVDGPSGSGKSSVSKGTARRLGLRYLDTGAQYRAMTYWMLQNKVDVSDPTAVAEAVAEPQLVSATDPSHPAISVDGVDASAEIRTAEVTAAVSAVSAVPAVRQRLIAAQREIIADALADGRPGIVVEGRDIAAVVAPDADAKIFLTASEEARAQRRNTEHGGGSGSVAATRDALARRDTADSRTNVLDAAPGAVVVDATELTLRQVIDRVCDIVLTAGSPSPAADTQGVGQP